MVKIASDLVLWDLKIFAFEISAHFFCFQPWKAKNPKTNQYKSLKEHSFLSLLAQIFIKILLVLPQNYQNMFQIKL